MFIDCDRTLLNDKGLVTERTRNAIRSAIQNGVKVIFASGRAPSGIEKIIKRIGAEDLFDYYVCFNGGLIIKSRDKQIISENTLGFKDIIKIADNINCAPENYYVVTSDELICNGNNKYAIIEAKKNSMTVTQEDVRQHGVDEKYFKMVFAGTKEWLDIIEQQIPETLRKQYNTTRSEPNNLEFVSLQASKGHALTKLADILNIRIQDTISFGDSENDSSMLTLAGTGIAMGNANEELKGIADYVTDNNNNDGLAKAIERYILL